MNCGLINSVIFTLFFFLFLRFVWDSSLLIWASGLIVLWLKKKKKQGFCDFNPIKSATYLLESRSFILF